MTKRRRLEVYAQLCLYAYRELTAPAHEQGHAHATRQAFVLGASLATGINVHALYLDAYAKERADCLRLGLIAA